MAFYPSTSIPTQKVINAGAAQVVPLADVQNQPSIYMLADSAGLMFMRMGDATLDPATADIPLPPGAFGTWSRGNATHIAISGAGTLYLTYGQGD